MPLPSGVHLPAFEAQNRALDLYVGRLQCTPLFAAPSLLETASLSLKHACPKGLYLAPVPGEPNLWEGVLFVRAGRLYMRSEVHHHY